MAASQDLEQYNAYIEDMRKHEYPMLKDALYLDHAGTTLYSKRLMDRFQADMMASLLGNPHSAAPSSQKATYDIESTRIQALQFFGADPEVFDLVFTANATSAIKLVMEAFREQDGDFWYGYHVDSHTSLVGVRESAKEHRCFETDAEVEKWIDQCSCLHDEGVQLFAYPAQSNMDGRRLPLDWPRRISSSRSTARRFALLDAAAMAATSPLRLADSNSAPDFTVLSFSKIFGFPDLGGLVVKKDVARLFQRRRYFGGGTVDMVVCLKEQWHAVKSGAIHEKLEDGTLPVHSIIALKSAMPLHAALFGSMTRVAEHTTTLAQKLFENLDRLRHANGRRVCQIYKDSTSSYADCQTQGPTIVFNLKDSRGRWVSNTEVEKLSAIKDIHIRTGGVCNPGGVAKYLNLSPWELRENFSAGFRCGSDNDIISGKPTGVIRVSLGAMSTRKDVERFTAFVEEFFIDESPSLSPQPTPTAIGGPKYYIESLTVYPIKSCGGWHIPVDTAWDVRDEGLAWDREWCIVQGGTGTALSQKRHPRMARIRPQLDFKQGLLNIGLAGSIARISVPLSQDPKVFESANLKDCNTIVCGDTVIARVYTSKAIADFFTAAVGVPCTLARFPPATQASSSTRHSKAHLGIPGRQPRPLLLSNESPILTISRSSLNRLNETIKATGGKAAHPAVFRANIILAEDPFASPGQERPWAEDQWRGMQIGDSRFEFLGGCRRCQMVCVDQESGEKDQEPFVTLAKTRRSEGRVLFGVHTRLEGEIGRITVGDAARTWREADGDVVS